MADAWRVALVALLAAPAAGCITHYIDQKVGITDAKALHTTGVPARARIVKISDSGMTINEDPVVDFVLEIRRDDGSTYQATTRAPISRLDVPRFQPGAEVPIRIDPGNPAHVAIDAYTYKY
jgi:hypothetical protein